MGDTRPNGTVEKCYLVPYYISLLLDTLGSFFYFRESSYAKIPYCYCNVKLI